MPRATTSVNDTERVDLKSLPEGYVVLRRMTYGQYLTRREMMSQMAMKQGRGQNMEAMINALNKHVVEFEFQKCVVEHNLENDNGDLLDFVKQPAVAFELLDPRIGEEIAAKIGQMNNFEEDLGNSNSGSTTSSTTGDPQTEATAS